MTQSSTNKTQYFEYNLSANKKGKKLSGPAIERAKTGQCDYTAFDPITGIGITEAKGGRPTQEDRSDFKQILYGVDLNDKQISEDIDLNDQQITEVFRESFAIAQKKCGSSMYGGATLVSVLVKKDKIYVANVGDSNAILLLMDKANNIICRRINNLHNPDEPSERAWLDINEGSVQWGRLGGMLAVSRAIGDNDFEIYGIRHTPDFYSINLATGKNQDNKVVIKSAYKVLGLILACDGLHEQDPDLVQMADRIENYLRHIQIDYEKDIHIDTQELSQLLVAGAYQDQSRDNLTAMIIPLESAHTTPVIAMVADGHGGSTVSEALRQEFIPIILEQLKKMK